LLFSSNLIINQFIILCVGIGVVSSCSGCYPVPLIIPLAEGLA